MFPEQFIAVGFANLIAIDLQQHHDSLYNLWQFDNVQLLNFFD